MINIYRSKLIWFKTYCQDTQTDTQAHTHTEPIAAPGPLNWSVVKAVKVD